MLLFDLMMENVSYGKYPWVQQQIQVMADRYCYVFTTKTVFDLA